MFVSKFIEKYMAGNELFCISLYRLNYLDYKRNERRCSVQVCCGVSGMILLVNTERTYKPLWTAACLFICQLSFSLSERKIWQFHLWYLPLDFPADLHFSVLTRELFGGVEGCLKCTLRITRKIFNVGSSDANIAREISWIIKSFFYPNRAWHHTSHTVRHTRWSNPRG